MNTSSNHAHKRNRTHERNRADECFAVRRARFACFVLLCCLLMLADATNAQSVAAPATTDTGNTNVATGSGTANKASDATHAADDASVKVEGVAPEVKAGMMSVAPKIDGLMSADEWKDATPFALS